MNLPKLLTDRELDKTITEVKSVSDLIKIQYTRKPKFTQSERYYIIWLIANCYSTNEIKEDVFTKFRKNIDTSLIWQYKHSKSWIPVIRKIREEYCINVPAADGSHKRTRLERLDRAYDLAQSRGDLDNITKINHQQMREMGDKVEGDTTNVFWNNPIYQQFSNLSTEELLKRQQEATKKLRERNEKEE